MNKIYNLFLNTKVLNVVIFISQLSLDTATNTPTPILLNSDNFIFASCPGEFFQAVIAASAEGYPAAIFSPFISDEAVKHCVPFGLVCEKE